MTTLTESRNTKAENDSRQAATRDASQSESGNASSAQRDSANPVASVTASVRVLTIGCNQMTLGLLRQLDTVQADAIEPIGRVRTRPQDGGGIELVGVTVEGVLAAAVIRPPSWKGLGSIDFDHWVGHAHPEWIGRTVAVTSDRGRRLSWVASTFSHPLTKSRRDRIRCGQPYLEEQWRAEAAAELTEVVAAQKAYDMARRLPLLVLPGVR
jgi:hypothetical protein